jgi:hypothetical protein
MNKHEKLANYLASGMKDYAEGISIMKELDIDSKSIDFLNVPKPTAIHENLLRKKLVDYARINNVKPAFLKQEVAAPAKSSGKTIDLKKSAGSTGNQKLRIDTNPFVRFEDLPFEYQEKYKAAAELKNQQKTLHAELKALKDLTHDQSKARRADLSNQLVNNKTQEKTLWAEIDEWWNANKHKSKEQQIAESAAKGAIDKQNRIKANKTFIQRNYGNPKKTEELEKRMTELKEWGVDYDEDITKSGKNTNPAQ